MPLIKLEEIQQHTDYPFLDIRKLEQYLLAQQYWLCIAKHALGDGFADWEFWLAQDPGLDGSNIFSIRQKNRGKGIVLDQQCVAADREEYSQEHRPLALFLDHWEDEDDRHRMPYIKMFTRITSDTQREVAWFFRFWAEAGTSEEKMLAAMDYYYNKPK